MRRAIERMRAWPVWWAGCAVDFNAPLAISVNGNFPVDVRRLYREHAASGTSPRAVITMVDGEFKIRHTVRSEFSVEEGQYINLWVPSIRAAYFLQSHPLTVTSCENGEPTTLDLLVDPRNGSRSSFSDLPRCGSGSESYLASFTRLGSSSITQDCWGRR
jgi:FAD-binding domain